MNVLKFILKIGIVIFLFSTTLANAEENPKEFFSKYIHLGDTFDPAVADLYDDGAQVLAYRVYPHGLERSMELTGIQWKGLVKKVMPLAKSKNDKSRFSNIVITKTENGFKIKADRYSVSKCYTDSGYYMVIKPSEEGNLVIVKEYMETKPLPSC